MRFVLLLLIALAVRCFGAICYVDYSAGSDAAAGTSTGAAWKHCPGDTNATGNAASATLSAGDSVVFKGGIVYSNSVVLSFSGTAGNPITYDGSGSTWGTGKAVIDGNYLLDGHGLNLNSGVSYVTITGFEIRNFGGYADDDPVVLAAANGDYGNGTNAVSTPRYGDGIYMGNGPNTNIFLSNLYVHHMGIWHHTLGWNGASVSGCGIWSENPVGMTVTNCEFTQIGGSAVEVLGSGVVKDVAILDCYLHDEIPTWGIDIAAETTGVLFTNVTVTRTRFINLGSQWTGTPDVPPTSAPHQNYLFIRANGVLSYWQNINVTRCLFMETNSLASEDAGGSGTIQLNNGASANIYNNVFCRPATFNGILFQNALPTEGMTQTIRFFNNTLQRVSGGMIVGGPGLYLLNNVFLDWTNMTANAVRLDSNPDPPSLMDYNLYWHPTITTQYYYVARLVATSYLFPEFQALGFETHGLYADPLFVDSTNANESQRHFSVVAGSPAISAGTNLSAFFTTDYLGNPRPAVGAWTIGAFESTNATPQTAGGGVLIWAF